MKRFFPILLIISTIMPPHLNAGPIPAVNQVLISLLPPEQTDPERPPLHLGLLLRSPGPFFYKLETTGKTLSSGRLVRGDLTVRLSWREMERIGRVPLTLSVMDQDAVSRRELCLIFSSIPEPSSREEAFFPAGSPSGKFRGEKPRIHIETRTSKEFEPVLRDIRATPAPARPYELVDPQVFARASISPINLLLFAAASLAKTILKKKPKPLDEIRCSYRGQGKDNQQKRIFMQVCIINRALPEKNPAS